jgi:hypothetical protein
MRHCCAIQVVSVSDLGTKCGSVFTPRHIRVSNTYHNLLLSGRPADSRSGTRDACRVIRLVGEGRAQTDDW